MFSQVFTITQGEGILENLAPKIKCSRTGNRVSAFTRGPGNPIFHLP